MTLRLLILVCLCLVALDVTGQYASDGGRFSVAEITACAPYGNPIVVNAPECDGTTTACSIDFDYGDGVPNTLALVDGDSFNYTYSEPGTYIIRIQFGTTGGFDQITLTILPDEAPDFNIYTCSGNRIQLDITDTNYSAYSIDYESDGTIDATSASGLVPFHTYPTSTPKTVTVRPDYVNCSATSKTVTPVPGPFSPPAPIISQLALENNQIELNLNTAPYYLYQLDFSTNNATSWSKLQDISNETTLSPALADPQNDFYCFRMGSVDICDGSAPVYTGSNTICSAVTAIDIANDEIALSWNTSNTGVNAFTIERTPGPDATTPAAPPFAYTDTDVVCGTTYSYRVIHEYGSGIRSLSEVTTGTAVSNRTPSTIDNVTTVINGDAAELSWLQDPAFTADLYEVFRVVNGSSSLAATTPAASHTDGGRNAEDEICYQIRYRDVCGNQSLTGETVCPLSLTATLEDNNSVLLTWTAYNGWAGGVDHYVIEKFDASGQLVESINAGSVTSYQDPNTTGSGDQIFTYRVLAVASELTQLPDPSISNVQRIVKNPNLSHPTAFIPQSSLSENRSFRVFGSFINTYHLKIFNRWGELIFESLDPESGWDGTFRGQQMPEGTYVFQARITDFAGRNFDYAGTVVLLKKG